MQGEGGSVGRVHDPRVGFAPGLISTEKNDRIGAWIFPKIDEGGGGGGTRRSADKVMMATECGKRSTLVRLRKRARQPSEEDFQVEHDATCAAREERGRFSFSLSYFF